MRALIDNNRVRHAIAGIVLISGVALTLFGHWEMGGESWGYWFFARLFSENGHFNIFDRSPVYVLYLSAFRWLGYPYCVAAEHIVSGAIIAIAITCLVRPYCSLSSSVFASLLWTPTLLLGMEPPPQKLALACSCFAVVMRRGTPSRSQVAASYAFLVLAYFFRPTYLVLALIFLAWDAYQLFRSAGTKTLFATVKPRLSTDWPVYAALLLGVWFWAMQSPHQFNNAQFSSTRWFPGDNPTSLAEAHFLQGFNWKYIEHQYGSFEGRDFYFTNQELFKGATTVWGAVRANPVFLLEQVLRNLATGVQVLVSFATELPVYGFRFFVIPAIILAVVYFGAFRAARLDASMGLFVLGHIPLIASGFTITPESARHYCPVVAVLCLSACWFGNQGYLLLRRLPLSRFLSRFGLMTGLLVPVFLYWLLAYKSTSTKGATFFVVAGFAAFAVSAISRYGGQAPSSQKWITMFRFAAVPMALLLFSPGATKWPELLGGIVHDLRQRDVRVLENRGGTSMKGSFSRLKPLVEGRKGVIALEHCFVYAFMEVPVGGIFDIWEIPPMGRLGQSPYEGLTPDRIDCVLISHTLSTAIGAATNIQLRYQNYIRPYADTLASMGAVVVDVEGYGKVVALEKHP